MSSPPTKCPEPTGPAADPKYPPCISPSNPYDFPPPLFEASNLEPLVDTTHVYFLGHEGTNPHITLSQWFPSPFTGPRNPYSSPPDNHPVTFPTAEHFMMYHKALLMNDTEIAGEVLDPENAHPSRAKALGRKVRNFDKEVWNEHADRVVEEGNVRKFGQREEMKAVLLGTGEKVLVEASPEDRIWGVGFNRDQAKGREAEWGSNRLGKALMKARERLRNGESAQ